MSSIRVATRKDGSVRTQVLFRVLDPQTGQHVQTSESFGDYGEALQWRKVLDALGPDPARALRRGSEEKTVDAVTLVAWLQAYVKGLTGIEEGTRAKYDRYIDKDIEPFFTEMLPLASLCAYDWDEVSPVQEWVRHLEGRFSAKTIANKHGFLSAALSAAVRRRPGLLPFNPCQETTLPRWHYEATFLEAEEFALLYALTPSRWRSQVLFRVATGARPSEVTAATVGDIGRYIDPDGLAHHTFRISKAWKYTGSNNAPKLGVTKSRK